MDVARLLGFLRNQFPDSPSWGVGKGTLPRGLDSTCLEALRAVGVSTAFSLNAALSSRRFRDASETLAADLGEIPSGCLIWLSWF